MPDRQQLPIIAIVFGFIAALAIVSNIIRFFQEYLSDKTAISAVTPGGWRWTVDAQKDGQRHIVHSDELLSAFLELEATVL